MWTAGRDASNISTKMNAATTPIALAKTLALALERSLSASQWIVTDEAKVLAESLFALRTLVPTASRTHTATPALILRRQTVGRQISGAGILLETSALRLA